MLLWKYTFKVVVTLFLIQGVLYFVLNGGKQMQPEEAVDKPALKDSQLFQSGTSTVEGETPALIELNGINPQNDNSKKEIKRA